MSCRFLSCGPDGRSGDHQHIALPKEVEHETASRQGNESRLTAERLKDFEQVLWIPRCAFAASFDGSFVCGLAHQIEGEVADDRHVLGAVACSQA
jgi:hypothetical protein